MEDLVVGSSRSIRLRRACERNRLEKQFLIDAYEHLVMHVVSEEPRNILDDTVATEEEASAEHARASKACSFGPV
jgi:hypothetical protein